MDHNALQGVLGEVFSSRLVGAIDHHEDEGKVPKDCEPRLITKTGSCTSLVTKACRDSWDKMEAPPDEHSNGLSDARLAMFAVASILIDTRNLQDKNKTTEHDKLAVEFLEQKIKACSETKSTYSRDEFFKTIDDAKRDIGGLVLHDILVKDYKQWNEQGLKLGISSVVKPMSFLLNKANDELGSTDSTQPLLQATKHYAEENGLQLFSIMTSSTDEEGQFRRELFLEAFGKEAVNTASKFVEQASEELELEEMKVGGNAELADSQAEHFVRAWRQHNTAASRKQVAPLMRNAMSNGTARM